MTFAEFQEEHEWFDGELTVPEQLERYYKGHWDIKTHSW